jgi:hypothetical protein
LLAADPVMQQNVRSVLALAPHRIQLIAASIVTMIDNLVRPFRLSVGLISH